MISTNWTLRRSAFTGGGALDGRFDYTPYFFALTGLPPETPRWGKSFKAALNHNFARTMEIHCSGTSLPVETNSFSLGPDLKDAWGLPALRMTYKDHPDDLRTSFRGKAQRYGARGKTLSNWRESLHAAAVTSALP